MLAGDGALQGALTTHERTTGGVLKDAAVGGALGLGLGSAARGLKRLASTPTDAAQAGREVLDAANRLSRDGIQVSPLAADVGGPVTRALTAGNEAGIFSGAPIRRSVDRYIDATGAVRDRAANALAPGQSARPLYDVADDLANGVEGLGDYEQRSAERIGKMYDDAQALTGDAQIPTPRTLDALNSLIAQREAMPGEVPGLSALRSLRDDLTPVAPVTAKPTIWDREFGGAVPSTTPGNPATYAIDSLRRLRTSFGDNFDANQRAAQEAAKELWGPLSEDIQGGLRGIGKADAADAYRAADKAWAERQTNLDEIVNPILGIRNQGQLARKIIDITQNDPDLLDRALSVVSPDQASGVRGGIVKELGNASPGQQNAQGDAFSLNGFLTDWNKLSDSAKSKLLDAQTHSDLDDLASLAGAARVSGRYRNTSGTARAMDGIAFLKALAGNGAGAGLGGIVGGIPGAALGAAAQYGSGRIMASPTTARLAVRLGEVRPASRSAQWLARLGQYAGPVVFNDASGPSE